MSELKEGISVLFEGIEVSEDQLEKFQTNLEAVISEKVSAYKAEIDEANEKVIAEKVEEETADLTNKIDDYLSYVVESWSEENALAIESGLKVELMESFIDGMKDLFAEHYVDVPEDKQDLVTIAESKVEELTADLNVAIEKTIALKKEIQESKKDNVIKEASADLTETQKEKFGSLIEGIDFSDIETFEKKVKTIRESFFKSDEIKDENKEEDVIDNKNDKMSRYVNAL